MLTQARLLLRLVRLPNLIVVAVTQYLICYHVVHPALLEAGIAPALYQSKFFELCLTTLIITASGYVVNDLQDEKIDWINRPGTNPVAALGRDFVLWFYGALILCGFLISSLLAFRMGERDFLWFYPVATGVLAVYSRYLKKKPLAGNVIVALYCAGVIALTVAAEWRALGELARIDPAAATSVWRVCYLFMAIAVLATLLREVVKDLEDIRGDRVASRKTIPVMWGEKTGRRAALGLGLTVLAALALPLILDWPVFRGGLLFGWLSLLTLSLLFILSQVQKARTQPEYGRISAELKFFLFGGLMLILLL